MTISQTSNTITGSFTTEELLALARGLDLPLPWLLQGTPAEDWPDAVRREIEGIGARSLLARELVTQADGEWATTEPLAAMIRVLCEPLLAIGVARISNEAIAYWTYVARPDWAVSHSVSSAGIHTISLFLTSQLLSAVTVSSGLRQAARPEGPGVTVPVEPMSALAEANGGKDVAALRAAGFDEASAALVSLLSEETGRSSIVTVLSPDSDHSIIGSMTAWVDGAEEGLWMVEPDDDGHPASQVRFSPADTEAILDSIRSGLPGAAS